MRPYIISVLSICISVIALAVAAAQHSRAADEATRIEVDQRSNVIRFIVEGQEQAVLHAGGLHVKGDITYGGLIKDVGGEGYYPLAGEGGADAQ